MTGFSHAVTGATIAALVKEPLIALPAAFLSHFVCDMIPHIGIRDVHDRLARRNLAHTIYVIDLVCILAFFGFLILLNAPWYVLAGAFLAGSPDFVWFYRYIIEEKFGTLAPTKMNILNHIHSKIQWSETLRYGVAVELAFSFVLIVLLLENI